VIAVSRRKKRNSDFDLAKLIVGSILLLSFAYTGNLKGALQLGVTVLVIGGGLVGLALFIQRGRTATTVTSRSSPQRSRVKQYVEDPPIADLDKEFDRQSRAPVDAEATKPVEWSRELIRSLDWKRFEELCAAYFEAKGRKAKVTDLGADGGIDVLLYGESDPEKILGVVQCKAWKDRPVGVKEIRELLGLMTDADCPLGIYITTSSYTPNAKAFAEGKHIKLMDAGQLLKLIQGLPLEAQTALLQKTTTGDYTTPSCPNCGAKLVSRTTRKGKNAGQSFWGCPNFPRCKYTMPCRKSA
jgi:restriction system protein